MKSSTSWSVTFPLPPRCSGALAGADWTDLRTPRVPLRTSCPGPTGLPLWACALWAWVHWKHAKNLLLILSEDSVDFWCQILLVSWSDQLVLFLLPFPVCLFFWSLNQLRVRTHWEDGLEMWPITDGKSGLEGFLTSGQRG